MQCEDLIIILSKSSGQGELILDKAVLYLST